MNQFYRYFRKKFGSDSIEFSKLITEERNLQEITSDYRGLSDVILIKNYSKIKFGYTARRRSLIEDAKFEQNVLKVEYPVEELESETKDDNESITLYKLIVTIDNQQNCLVKLIDTLQVV